MATYRRFPLGEREKIIEAYRATEREHSSQQKLIEDISKGLREARSKPVLNTYRETQRVEVIPPPLKVVTQPKKEEVKLVRREEDKSIFGDWLAFNSPKEETSLVKILYILSLYPLAWVVIVIGRLFSKINKPNKEGKTIFKRLKEAIILILK